MQCTVTLLVCSAAVRHLLLLPSSNVRCRLPHSIASHRTTQAKHPLQGQVQHQALQQRACCGSAASLTTALPLLRQASTGGHDNAPNIWHCSRTCCTPACFGKQYTSHTSQYIRASHVDSTAGPVRHSTVEQEHVGHFYRYSRELSCIWQHSRTSLVQQVATDIHDAAAVRRIQS
jgi:hypothetical protein